MWGFHLGLSSVVRVVVGEKLELVDGLWSFLSWLLLDYLWVGNSVFSGSAVVPGKCLVLKG